MPKLRLYPKQSLPEVFLRAFLSVRMICNSNILWVIMCCSAVWLLGIRTVDFIIAHSHGKSIFQLNPRLHKRGDARRGGRTLAEPGGWQSPDPPNVPGSACCAAHALLQQRALHPKKSLIQPLSGIAPKIALPGTFGAAALPMRLKQ